MENRVKQIERWETSDGRWFELLTAAHDHQEKLVDMADEIERLQRERDEYKTIVEGMTRSGFNGLSDIPCCKCGGPVVEFSVPNEAWNTVIRNNGPETDQEYLCVKCFALVAADRLNTAQAIVAKLPKTADGVPISDGDYTVCDDVYPMQHHWKIRLKSVDAVKIAKQATGNVVAAVKAKLERLRRERDELQDHNDKLRDVVQDALCDMTLKCMDSTRSKLQAVRGVRIDQLPSPAQWEAVCKNEQMLQAIVAELPKCWQFNTDKTELVQDCPVVPGMTVFAVRRGCVVPKHRIVEFVVYVIDPTTIGDCDRLRFQVEDCYNTLEAVEFAKD